MYLKRFFETSQQPCGHCQSDNLLDFEVRMAFQPIVDVADRSIFAYEALVRGSNGEGAGEVIAQVHPEQLYRFDQTCRVAAIATAARLGLQQRLSINFNPNAVYEPATCIRMTLAAASQCDFDPARLIFEVTESEKVRDTAHLVRIIDDYKQRGFLTAIDDFGVGYAGLNLLAEFQLDIVKLDMALVRDVHQHRPRRSIVGGIVAACRGMDCEVLAEGVETLEEYRALRDMGIHLFQGYLFARPALEVLPMIDARLWDTLDA